MKKRESVSMLRRAAGVALVGTLLSGAALTASAKDFRWAFQSDAVTMDPYNINETMTLGFMGNIYEGLIRRNEKFEIEPALATEWSTPEPTKWTPLFAASA